MDAAKEETPLVDKEEPKRAPALPLMHQASANHLVRATQPQEGEQFDAAVVKAQIRFAAKALYGIFGFLFLVGLIVPAFELYVILHSGPGTDCTCTSNIPLWFKIDMARGVFVLAEFALVIVFVHTAVPLLEEQIDDPENLVGAAGPDPAMVMQKLVAHGGCAILELGCMCCGFIVISVLNLISLIYGFIVLYQGYSSCCHLLWTSCCVFVVLNAVSFLNGACSGMLNKQQ